MYIFLEKAKKKNNNIELVIRILGGVSENKRSFTGVS
jgi:hypothetical protein